MTKPNNPWLSICWENRIASCDIDFPFPTSMAEKLQFDTLPEPYTGSPDADVYCLGMNPGERDSLFECNEKNQQLLLEYTRKTLAHETEDNIWNILTEHSGYCWWKNVTRELRKELRRNPKMFIIEYFPYHSKDGFPFPSHLPSYSYSDWLIEKAIIDMKYILILRHKREWLKRIEKLKSYKRLFYLDPKKVRRLVISRDIIRKGDNCSCEVDEMIKHF